MKLTEKILVSLFILSIILGVFHLPGSGFLFIISAGCLTILYLIFSFIVFNDRGFRELLANEKRNKPSNKKLGLAVGVGVVLWLAILGIIVKYFSFPGSTFFMGIGFLACMIMAIVVKKEKDQDSLLKRMFNRLVFFGGLCLFLLVLPTEIWLNWKYPENPEYVQAVLEARENPDNQALWDKVDEERKKLR